MSRPAGSNKANGKTPSREFFCYRCGSRYTKQEGNFSKVRSNMYAGGDGYLPWCRKCVIEMFTQFESQFDTEEAIRRTCMKLDIYWSPAVFEMTKNSSATQPRILSYISKANLLQIKGTCYDDTLVEETGLGEITSIDDFAERKSTGQTEISEKTIEKFGMGFTDDEYRLMESHYKMLTKNLENIDFVQETLIRDLCTIKAQQSRAIIDKDTDKYEKCTKLYQTTLTSAKVRSSDAQVGKDDTFGAYLAYIETHCPADYYTDKLKYWDVLGTSEYAERHIYRPMKNWFTGSKDQDKEFYIEDEETNDMS